jgi:predicted  nucleic acid-binding Zn-ribbon protein
LAARRDFAAAPFVAIPVALGNLGYNERAGRDFVAALAISLDKAFAMAVSADLLELLHRIHRQLGDLRDRHERGPRQIRAREANVAKLEGELAAAQDAVKQAKLIGDRKQLDLKASEQRIADWKVKLNTCNSNKEFQTMKEQIAAAEMAGSVLQDEILESMERVDQLELSVTAARDKLNAGKTELSKFRDSVAQESQSVVNDIKRLEGELVEAEKGLPVEFRADYDRIIRAKGADGMARMEEGTCEGCGRSVTLNQQNNLMLSKPVFCTACGRLLYRAAK